MQNPTEDLLTSALEGRDAQGLYDELVTKIQAMGYDWVSYLSFFAIDRGIDPFSTINYTETWTRHYAAENYIEHDVLIPTALASGRPVEWDKAKAIETLSPTQKRIFRHGHDAKHLRGITFPFHGPMGPAATLSLATTHPSEADNPFKTYALAAQFHALYEQIVAPVEIPAERPHLSPRLREVLQWASEGLTSQQIGYKMNLSSQVVDMYVARACQQLGVSGRIKAVLVAARAGLIRF